MIGSKGDTTNISNNKRYLTIVIDKFLEVHSVIVSRIIKHIFRALCEEEDAVYVRGRRWVVRVGKRGAIIQREVARRCQACEK